jgi:nucleoid-associated protein EbfC
MKNLGNMMKQAQQMQAKMAEMQNSLNEMQVNGISGGGMVHVTLNGKFELKSLKIEPSAVSPEDVEMLEDLILAAFNDAKSKVETMVQDEMSKLTGGMNLPAGFKLPF